MSVRGVGSLPNQCMTQSQDSLYSGMTCKCQQRTVWDIDRGRSMVTVVRDGELQCTTI